jgi:CubicO group peptidase (beta-lactamase class C family)
MKKCFPKTLILLLPVLCFSFCIQAQTPVEEQIKRVENGLVGAVQLQDSVNESSLAERMAYFKVNGVSIAVVHNYQLVWAKGYGWADAAAKRPVTAQTRFQAASISKSVNALGVLHLVEQGKLDLQEDINTYLRSWKFPYDTVSHGKKINVAQLLSHTAGLGVHGFPGYGVQDTLPADNEILDGKRPANTAAVRSITEPGKRYQYSGGGTTITKKIIIDLSGMPYDQYMDKYVLQPLGMRNSSYTQPPQAALLPQLATAYTWNGQPLKGNFHIYPEQAADGLWTTPSDLARFIIGIQLTLKGQQQKGVPSRQLLDTMLRPYGNPNAALGVFIMGKGREGYFQHGGANEGFRCQYFGSLENGNGVAVMVNSDDGRIIPEIINSVAIAYQWPGFYKADIRKLANVPVDTLAAYTGRYVLFARDTVTVKLEGAQLYLSQNGSPFVRMYFTTPNSFFIKEEPGNVTFEKDKKGVVNRLEVRQGEQIFKAMKI